MKKQSLKKKLRSLRWIAFFCMAIILGSVVSVASVKSDDSALFQTFSSNEESGYEIKVTVDKVWHADFNGEIAEVHDIVLKQKQNYKPYMSLYPLEYTKQFDTLDNAFRYVGLEIPDSFNSSDSAAKLNVLCDEKGNILQITIQTDSKMNGNNVQIWYYIFSDLMGNPSEGIVNGELLEEGFVTASKYDDSVIFKSVESEKNNYRISGELLKSGIQAPVITSGKNKNGIETAESYISKGHIVCRINVASKVGNHKGARDTLIEIMEIIDGH